MCASIILIVAVPTCVQPITGHVKRCRLNTVKTLNNGHIGGRSLVHCREVVLISEVR